MKKLPSFTLLELLIGMIISSLVIGFGYMTYNVIYQQYLSYKDVKEKIMDITQLNTTLSNDIREAELVWVDENNLICHKDLSEWRYKFYDDYIIRMNSELADTFKISSTNRKSVYLFPDDHTLLKQFSLEVNAVGEKEYFHFVKAYNAESLMNYRSLIETN